MQQNGSVAVNPFGADTGVSKAGDVEYLYLLHYMGDSVALAVSLLQLFGDVKIRLIFCLADVCFLALPIYVRARTRRAAGGVPP